MSGKGVTSVGEFIRTSRALDWNLHYPRPTIQPRTKKWFDAARRKCKTTKEIVDQRRTPNRSPPAVNHAASKHQGKASDGLPKTTRASQDLVQDAGSLAVLYNVTCELGHGTYGTVYRGWDKASGTDVAIKQIRSRRQGVGSGAAKMEASIMSQLQDCPSVVGMRTFIEDDLITSRGKEKVSYIVMDLCGGGDLNNFLMAHSPLREEQAAAVVTEVVRVLKQCHLNRIMHGDVKASNFVIDSLLSRRLLQTNPALLKPGWLKAIDFGTCRHIGIGFVSQTLGTPTHWSPEVFAKKASTPADMWSLGTLAYKLLAGSHPFWSEEEERSMRSTTDLLRMLVSRSPDYDIPALSNCSRNGVDFLRRLLVKDAESRMSIGDAESHPWLAMHPKGAAMDSNNLVPVASFCGCRRTGPKFPSL